MSVSFSTDIPNLCHGTVREISKKLGYKDGLPTVIDLSELETILELGENLGDDDPSMKVFLDGCRSAYEWGYPVLISY